MIGEWGFSQEDQHTGKQGVTSDTFDGDRNTSSFTVALRSPESLADMLAKCVCILMGMKQTGAKVSYIHKCMKNSRHL
jgi:hypothetical protein